jgi:hypothetical protein
MGHQNHPFWDFLSTAELDYTATVVQRLKNVEWARSLLDHARTRGSLPEQIRKAEAAGPENLSDLFELRFADELARSGAVAQYEFAAGVGGSTVDFRVTKHSEWLIELVSLRTTEAIKAATWQQEVAPGAQVFGHLLTSDSASKGNSSQEDMITAEAKIGTKAYEDGKPTKFPPPKTAFHAIIADMRGFGGAAGGEPFEYAQMSVGVSGIATEERDLALCFPGTRKPIKGLFEPSNPLPGASTVRERVHILGFVAERRYEEGGLTQGLFLFDNPFLFPDANAVWSAYERFPLDGARACRPVILPSSPRPAQ